MDRRLTVTDAKAPGGRRQQTWHYPSRAECFQCHNPWAGYALAFTLAQLNKDHDYGPAIDNQLRTLEHAGIVTMVAQNKGGRMKLPAKLSDPHDPAVSLDERARSYLHVNCSHCHQFGAGGTADLTLRHEVPLTQTKIL